MLNTRKPFAVSSSDLADITCPICLEVFVKSTATTCGHQFCESCLFESFLRKPVTWFPS